MAKSSKQGGKNKKYGRMEKWCQAYRAGNQELRNRLRRMRRHLRNNPGDNTNLAHYKELGGKINW